MMRSALRLSRASVWCVVSAIALACGGNETKDVVTPAPPVPSRAATLEVSPDSLVIERGKSAQLNARFLDATGLPLNDPQPSFTSLDPLVATVSAFGSVTAVTVGETRILVSGEKLAREVKVRVFATAAFIEVTPRDATIRQFGTVKLSARVLDANRVEIPGAPVEFSSSSPSLAIVSRDGLVASAGPAGFTAISARSGSILSASTLQVLPVPRDIDFGRTSLALYKWGVAAVTPVVHDLVGGVIERADITYSTPDPTMLAVSPSGVVRSTGNLGTTAVTVTFGDVSQTLPVTVGPPTHPAGVIGERWQVGNTAYDVAIGRTGVVYVARGSAPPVRTDLPLVRPIFSDVSSVPSSRAVVFNRAGTVAYFAGGGGTLLYAVDPTTDRVIWKLDRTTGTPLEVVLSPDETTIYVSTQDRLLVAVDAETRATLWDITVPIVPEFIAPDPIRPMMYISGDPLGNIVEFDLVTRVPRFNKIDEGSRATRSVAPLLDGSALMVGTTTGLGVELLDLVGGTRKNVSILCTPEGFDYTPDGERVLTACGIFGAYVAEVSPTIIWNRRGGVISRTARRIASSPDGTFALTANEEGDVTIIR